VVALLTIVEAGIDEDSREAACSDAEWFAVTQHGVLLPIVSSRHHLHRIGDEPSLMHAWSQRATLSIRFT
jgi:hypothetical protein